MSGLSGRKNRQWRILNGSDHWKDLIDPLDDGLRRTLIHYGELAQAAHDAFITERFSRFAGDCRYARATLLERCCVGSASYYEVTKNLYATSSVPVPEALMVKSLSREAWNRESNWMGFVAVATDAGKAQLGRREIVVAWRGTSRPLEWINDLQFNLVSPSKLFSGDESRWSVGATGEAAKVHEGWLSIYTSNDPRSPYNQTSARDQLLNEVKRLIELHKDEELSITFTGHSLGAALSTLSAMDIAANGINKVRGIILDRQIPVSVLVFASPKVGDAAFRQVFSKIDSLRLLRVANAPDIVPAYPLLGYEEVGVELTIDTRKSPYLKGPGDFSSWHNLEAYLHGIAGTQGTRSSEFRLQVDRDIALVNKHLDLLKDEYLVPVSWWVEKNKGMKKGADGHWKLVDHEDDDA
ncbi:phospholipase A1-II 4-like [Nymphaea colorata]|nr:phospholipase A1-II 4-like [Nymphaea colorata]